MKTIKIILSVALLLCLLPLPYGYYSLVRWGAMVVFAILAYDYYKQNKNSLMIASIGLAILFQPLVKIALGRAMWNVVDVVVAVLLLVSVYTKRY